MGFFFDLFSYRHSLSRCLLNDHRSGNSSENVREQKLIRGGHFVPSTCGVTVSIGFVPKSTRFYGANLQNTTRVEKVLVENNIDSCTFNIQHSFLEITDKQIDNNLIFHNKKGVTVFPFIVVRPKKKSISIKVKRKKMSLRRIHSQQSNQSIGRFPVKDESSYPPKRTSEYSIPQSDSEFELNRETEYTDPNYQPDPPVEIVAKENKQVFYSRFLVIFVLACSAFGVAYLTFRFVSDEEKDDFFSFYFN